MCVENEKIESNKSLEKIFISHVGISGYEKNNKMTHIIKLFQVKRPIKLATLREPTFTHICLPKSNKMEKGENHFILHMHA